jgi:hypothetical protein
MLARTRLWLLLIAGCTSIFFYVPTPTAQSLVPASVPDCSERKDHSLPLPSTYLPGRLPKFQTKLTDFL